MAAAAAVAIPAIITAAQMAMTYRQGQEQKQLAREAADRQSRAQTQSIAAAVSQRRQSQTEARRANQVFADADLIADRARRSGRSATNLTGGVAPGSTNIGANPLLGQ